MTGEIQGLLEQIRKDGIELAEARKKQILSDAEKQAEMIISEAKKNAENMVKAAEEEARINEKKCNAAVQQAARDVLISLQTELQKRLERLVRGTLEEAISPEIMGTLIREMACRYLDSDQNSNLEILLSEQNAEKLESMLKSGLVSDLKKNPEIKISSNISAGLKIGVKGSDLFFDFSDDALTEIICSYAGQKLEKIIRG